MTRVSEALALFRRGDAPAALRLCEQALSLAPDDVEALALLADLSAARGDPETAARCHRRLTALRPSDAAGWRRLGDSELACQRFTAAAEALRMAVRLDPRNPRGHHNLGQALLRAGDVRGAIDGFTAALGLDPGYALAHYNLGLALAAAGDSARGLQALRQALALQPALRAIHVALAGLHAQRCEWPEALSACDDALRLHANDPALQVQRAAVLLALDRATDALGAVDAVVAAGAGSAAAYNIRGGALRRLGRHDEALVALDRAVALNPAFMDAWSNRGMVLHELGDAAAALASDRQAVALDPGAILPRTRLLARLVPPVPASAVEAVAARASFEAELAGFEAWIAARPLDEADALQAAEQQFFYLSYDEQSNRDLLTRYRTAAAARLAEVTRYERPAAAGTGTPPRLRIGFVSAHVHDHSVYNALLRGWLTGLDRERFEIRLFSLGRTEDASTRAAAAAADDFVSGARPTAEWARTLAGAGCDVLVYPELGMNSQCLALAALRLAPRQLAAWGHPETSGLPTIDGFLSAAAFEPPDAAAHYCEPLWRLPRLGVHCRAYGVVPAPVDLGALGLAGCGAVLVCAGVPQKYRPQDDALLVEIARGVGACRLVFFEGAIAAQSQKLVARIGAAFREAGMDPAAFLTLLPWQPRAAFFGLLGAADVYLDTLGFSGFNTLLQAVECGLPCVALEGVFMRGRLGSGILRTLGLDELVAVTRPQYVRIAVRLATDPGYRAGIRARLEAGRGGLWEDRTAVDALARILAGTAGDPSRP